MSQSIDKWVRLRIILVGIGLICLGVWIASRFFYLQVIKGPQLREEGSREYQKMCPVVPKQDQYYPKLPQVGGVHIDPSLKRVDDPFDVFTKKIEQLPEANIAFNAPTSMNLDDTVIIELILNLIKPIEKLKQQLNAAGEKQGERIRVSEEMEAHLTGTNFDIKPVTKENQGISLIEDTKWKWTVKPTRAGRQTLHLSLTAKLYSDSSSTVGCDFLAFFGHKLLKLLTRVSGKF
jgi:hypothetical protein